MERVLQLLQDPFDIKIQEQILEDWLNYFNFTEDERKLVKSRDYNINSMLTKS